MWMCLRCGVGGMPDSHKCKKQDIKRYAQEQLLEAAVLVKNKYLHDVRKDASMDMQIDMLINAIRLTKEAA